MTEHEDLIARLRAVVETALSDASAASSEFDCSESDYRATEAHCRELEAVRDELISALEKVTVERDQLAVALERIREYLVAIENSPGLGETGHHRRWLASAQEIATAPSVALDRVKAEALREAADDFETYWTSGAPVKHPPEVWLRRIADRIERGESNE